MIAYSNGIVAENQRDYKKAIECFTEALNAESSNEQARYHRALAYEQSGNIDGAIADLDEVILGDADNADAFFHRGWCLAAKSKFQDAIDNLTHAISLAPDDADNYFQRGWCYDQLKHFDAALTDYDKAVQLKPDARYLSFRAETLRHIGNLLRAKADADGAISLDPRLGQPYLTRAWLTYFGGDYASAVNDAATWLRLGGTNDEDAPYGLLVQYLALRHMGKLNDAKALLSEYQSKSAKFPATNRSDKRAWGETLFRYINHDIDDKVLLTEAGTDATKTMEASAIAGIDYSLDNKPAVAKTYLNTAIKHAPNHTLAYELAENELKLIDEKEPSAQPEVSSVAKKGTTN